MNCTKVEGLLLKRICKSSKSSTQQKQQRVGALVLYNNSRRRFFFFFSLSYGGGALQTSTYCCDTHSGFLNQTQFSWCIQCLHFAIFAVLLLLSRRDPLKIGSSHKIGMQFIVQKALTTYLKVVLQKSLPSLPSVFGSFSTVVG